MAFKFDNEEYEKELEELRELPHFQDEEVWRRALSSLSLRAVLRVLPLLAIKGDFSYWKKGERSGHLAGIQAALSVAFIRSTQTERVLDYRAAVAAAAAAAYHAANAAAASTAYAASKAAAYAYADGAYAAAAAAPAANAANAANAKLDDQLVRDLRNDINLLEQGKSDLNAEPLWIRGGVIAKDSELISKWRKALIGIGNEDFALWYDRFLEGNPDKESSLKWLDTWISNRERKQVSADSFKPKVRIKKNISPAGLSELATKDDKLRMKPYAEGLAQFLTNKETETPLTVSVEGNWGIGKTSFLMILKGQLAGRKVVWFNPWRHDEGEGLWSAFIVSFVDQMEKGMSWREKAMVRWKFWEKALGWKLFWLLLYPLCGVLLAVIWYYFKPDIYEGDLTGLGIYQFSSMKWIALPLGMIAWLLSLIPVWPQVQKEIKKFRQSLKSEVSQVWTVKDGVANVTAAEKFSERFRQFLDIYGKPDKPVFVIIDDLDRCAAPKAAELLDSLQLLIAGNGDEEKSFPVIFLLGLDREKVAAGVAVKYEAMLPYVGEGLSKCHKERLDSGREFGYEYLQKFIDVPFRLPVLTDENMEDFINDLAGEQVGKIEQAAAEEVNKSDSEEVKKGGVVESLYGTDNIDGLSKDTSTSEEDKEDEAITQKREEAQQKVQEKIERIDLKSTLLMSVPLLGHNPRRIKQYRNLLTLRVYLANANQLFEGHLTVEVLAKVVVLELARPTLYRSMCEDPNVAGGVSQFIKEEYGYAEKLLAGLSPLDRAWLETHAETLRTDLDGEPASFPTGAELSGVLSMSAPPSKVEAEVAKDSAAEGR